MIPRVNRTPICLSTLDLDDFHGNVTQWPFNVLSLPFISSRLVK